MYLSNFLPILAVSFPLLSSSSRFAHRQLIPAHVQSVFLSSFSSTSLLVTAAISPSPFLHLYPPPPPSPTSPSPPLPFSPPPPSFPPSPSSPLPPHSLSPHLLLLFPLVTLSPSYAVLTPGLSSPISSFSLLSSASSSFYSFLSSSLSFRSFFHLLVPLISSFLPFIS